jgi:hypothetical protein
MEDDLERQLLFVEAAIADARVLRDSRSAAIARMAKDGHDTSEAIRMFTRAEEMLQKDLELRDQLRKQR